MSKIIAITGGIGSGKSVVSRILRTIGYFVYDCDSEAKKLMESSQKIKIDLKLEFGNEIFLPDNEINRKSLSHIVFNDKNKLQKLNRIVHTAVKEDISKWMLRLKDENMLFIESAILKESNLDKIIDEIWCVVAPEKIRIERVMQRNNFTYEEVKARIEAQNKDSIPNSKIISNYGNTPLLPQVFYLINNDAKKCKEFEEF